MKMGLSVVMDVINKTTGPLKTMTGDSDRYAKKIAEIKKAQSDDSGALHLIDSFRQIGIEADRNTLSLNEAAEKLEALKAKEKSAAKAGEKLNEDLANQTKELEKLKAKSTAAGGSNEALNKKILKQSEALEALRVKAAAANKPSAALTNQIAKQTETVARFTSVSHEHNQRLGQISKGMKKAGIDTGKLDDEYSRLTNSFDDHAKNIDKVSNKYKKLQAAMSPLQKMNKAIKLPSIDTVKNGAMMGGATLGTMAGFGVIISDTARQVNELSRAAQDVSMPVEELQAMRLQAKMAGAESEDMDAAIKEMSLRWGEMKTLKSGAMNDYFKDTGNGQAYKDLMNAADSAEAYQVLIREIAKESDVAKQNFMADEFFGGDSEKMLALLKAGPEGLDKAKQDLGDSGGPITQESIDASKDFETSLSKILNIIDSLKVSALTPVMKELSVIFADIAEKMKNTEWRAEALEKLRAVVSGVFAAFKALGNGVLFLSENYKGIMATIALLKIGFIALNAVMFANPIGLIVAGVAAAVVAVTYLIDKFVGLGTIMDGVKGFFGLGGDDEKTLEKVASVKDKSVELGVTTNETLNRNTNAKNVGAMPGGITSAQKMTPLMAQSVNSHAEVALTIKSDKPVAVDKANSDKGVGLNVNVGDMMMSY